MTASPSMDILVSSNLERLLYALCGATEVAVICSSCAGVTVSDALKAKIQATFAGGFCNDIQTREKIGHAWRERYLIDTHTAVAYHVLDDYRSETTATRRRIAVVSTASPFRVLRPGAARHRRHGRRLRPGADPPPVVRGNAIDRPRR